MNCKVARERNFHQLNSFRAMSENIKVRTANRTNDRLRRDHVLIRANSIGRIANKKRKLPITAKQPTASTNRPQNFRFATCAYEPMATSSPGNMNSSSTRNSSRNTANCCSTMCAASQSDFSIKSDSKVATAAQATPQISSSFLRPNP